MPQIRPIGVSGSIPSVNQLALGDIALNVYDGKAYIKKAVGNTQTVVELGTGGGGSSISASYAATASYSFFAITSSYAGTASYALNGGVTKLIAGTNVTLSPVEGTGIVTVNAVLASSGSGTPNGPIYSLQFNNGGVFSGSGNFTLLNNTDLNLTGSFRVLGSITGSLFGTASWANNAINATTASYVLNAVSSSFASTASYVELAKSASYVSLAQSASYVLNAVSASSVVSASYAAYAQNALMAVIANTASYVLNAVSSSFASTASYALAALTASFARTASFINPLSQSVFISGSTAITGSTGIYGNFSISNATLVDINTSVLNINAPTLQVPSFGLAYSPSANIRTVMYDAVSNALFVTSSLPGTGGGGGFANYIATGSVTASVQVGPAASIPYFFIIQSGSVEIVKVNANRVVVLESRTDIPTAVTGGIYYSASGDFFFGQ
jgi:hypothetical protein